jgi:hypothetical protein
MISSHAMRPPRAGAAIAAHRAGIPGIWHGFGRMIPDGIGLELPTRNAEAPGRPHLDICPPSLQDKDFLATEDRIELRPVPYSALPALPAWGSQRSSRPLFVDLVSWRAVDPGPKEINAARRVVAAADIPNRRRRWDLHDIVNAGSRMVTELRLLAVRPPTDELLVVVEEAITVWATLSGYLNDAWEIFETEPREVGSALAELHLRLCQVHDPVPLELAARLAKLVRDADGETFLDVPEGYADVLGVEGVAEFEGLLGGASR